MKSLFRSSPSPFVLAIVILCASHPVSATDDTDPDGAALETGAPASHDQAPDETSFSAPEAKQAEVDSGASSFDVDRVPFRIAGAALAVAGATLGVIAFVAVSVAVVVVFGYASSLVPQAAYLSEFRPLAVVLLPIYMGAGAGLAMGTVAKPSNALATGAIVAGATGLATLIGAFAGAAILGGLGAASGVGLPTTIQFGDPIVFGLIVGGFIGAFLGAIGGGAIGSMGSALTMGALVGDKPSWWNDVMPDGAE